MELDYRVEVLRTLRREQELEVSLCRLNQSMASEAHIKAADRLAALDMLIREAEKECKETESKQMEEMMRHQRNQ